VASLYEIRADGSIVLRLHVQPGASSDEVVGVHGDALKVKVRAPPDRGRANEAVVALVARTLGVPASSVTLVAGASSRAKRVAVVGVSPERLGNVLPDEGVARRHPPR
jgi:uncharacterized protein